MTIETLTPLNRTDVEIFHYEDDWSLLSLFDYLECFDNGRYYEIPINGNDLLGLLRSGVHHSSAIGAKLNILSSTFVQTAYLSHTEFSKFAYNYLVMGNAYLEAVRNRFGKVLHCQNRLALYMRKSSVDKGYVYLRGYRNPDEKLNAEDVAHIMQADLRQEVYGVPYYLAAMNSIELNASATRFRRRYYDNGSHAGFILYGTDAQINEEDWGNIKKQLRETKGKGNFKNMAVRSSGGKPEGLKLIPISEVAAKDEFLNIKSMSAEDMLAIHRVPPKLMGIVPQHAASLGDAKTDSEVFATNEVVPLQNLFLSINRQFGVEVFKFRAYQIGNNVE